MIPSSLVTDTHPLIYYVSKKERRLSRKARLAFDGAFSGEVIIHVPAYVLVEISQLIRRGKFQLSKPLREWASDLFSSKTFVLVPLDSSIAFRYDELSLR